MSSSPTPPSLAQRLSRLVRAQWVLATLMTLLCCADIAFAVQRGGTEVLALPGAALLALLAVRGRSHPALCGVAAAAVLVLSSGLLRVAGAEPHSLGMGAILPTENAAGVLLVLFAHRRLPPVKALPITAALVAACLVSLYVRTPTPDTTTLAFGVLQLLLAMGTGTYLRGWQFTAARTPLLELFGRQWPMIAALSVLVFAEATAYLQDGPGAIAMLLGALVLAVLAVIAPLRPVEAALLGSSALACMGVLNVLIRADRTNSSILPPLPITATAAGMLLMAYLVRYAARRKAWIGGSALVGAVLVAVFLDWVQKDRPDITAGMQILAFGGLLLALSVGSGVYFRTRDGERTRTVETAVEQAQQAERLALARELHDVVAHHVTGIVVQAQAAQMVAAQKPEAAAEAMERIASSGTEALVAMRRLVASMRGAEPAGTSGATEQATTDLAADLTSLAEGAGPKVRLLLDIGREVPQEVARSALRLVQESLTNAGKHAPDATEILVSVRSPQEHLHVRITDNGSGRRTAPVGGSGGYGLVGMRERIELLGGRFSAGPGEGTGWRVEAWLPLAERAAG
ncbi:histidine kinase [Saccharopolyspora sp. NFXS83]|uniref:sensor histidine kinase n=1 Tax=Saccharopolyspora sp. NFXS83 TaxID=2993560 RepID=UPI00224B0792|nr:histidine kinase [Saccharopolyspora sp. NFXS83]MCX2728616.1 histidine kinase [Saccharopolyspora sp. NFXS83]